MDDVSNSIWLLLIFLPSSSYSTGLSVAVTSWEISSTLTVARISFAEESKFSGPLTLIRFGVLVARPTAYPSAGSPFTVMLTGTLIVTTSSFLIFIVFVVPNVISSWSEYFFAVTSIGTASTLDSFEKSATAWKSVIPMERTILLFPFTVILTSSPSRIS